LKVHNDQQVNRMRDKFAAKLKTGSSHLPGLDQAGSSREANGSGAMLTRFFIEDITVLQEYEILK
jgi:hypothetical protein